MRRTTAALVTIAATTSLLAPPAVAVDDLAPADLPGVTAAARTTHAARAASGSPASVLGEDTGTWMVVFKHDATSKQVDAAIRRTEALGGHVTRRWSDAVTGFAVSADIAVAEQLAELPGLAHIEANNRVEALVTQQPASWGLDRIDQRDLPLDDSYTVSGDGNQVTAWVIDTGIRPTHDEFGTRVGPGHDTIGDDSDPEDCNGHGTHVAGTIGGVTWGVAQGITLRAVRALDCDGIGDEASIVDALNHVAQNATLPAVANMSLGGERSTTIENATAGVVNAGVTVVVAAGNDDGDACNASPARMDQVITVAATNDSDSRAFYSNWGSCIDVFAPGHQIRSAGHSTDDAIATMSGTSMAAPHVAGIAALALDADPNLTPAEVSALIRDTAARGRITDANGSPNLLAYAQLISDGRENPDPLDGCSDHDFVYTGTLSSSDDYVFLPPDSDYTITERKLQTGCTDGPDDADFDLSLVKLEGGEYVEVAAAESPSSDETISVETPAGQYAWVVSSYDGSGDFQFGFSIGEMVDTTSPSFSDVDEGHQFYDEIEWMAAEGISTGFDDGTFLPRAEVTRQAMSAFMHRLAGSPSVSGSCTEFTDVSADHQFCTAIAWMAAEGISTGFDDGTFLPNAEVTRQAMSAFMHRLAGSPSVSGSCTEFTDVSADHQFCTAIAWMAAEGISTGFDDGTFLPNADVTRQAMSAFMFRFDDGGHRPTSQLVLAPKSVT